MFKYLALLAVFLVVLPAQAQDIRRDALGSTFYIPPINPVPNWYEVRGGSWRVPLATLQEVRAIIETEIGHNKAFDLEGTNPRYAIQFRGETVDGRQVVRLIGACNGLGKSDWKLSEHFVQVYDGGRCYFEADYRPDDRQFRFRYNGHA